MGSTRWSVALLLGALVWLGAAAGASAQSALFVGGGGQLWSKPDLDGNGIALVHYRLPEVGGGEVQLEWNTDTVTAAWVGVPLGDGVSLSVFGRAEALLAGVLLHYHQMGQKLPQRGFNASYGQVGGRLALDRGWHHLNFELGGRRWAFSPNGETAGALTLPADTWVIETRARYTLWGFDGDASFAEPHRPTWRLSGVGAGAELGADLRSDGRPFGDLSGLAGGAPETRNEAGRTPAWLRGWAGMGHRLGAARLQVVERFGAGRGQDDVSRARVGGMNPYVVPTLGLPWATWLPNAYAATRLSLHLPIGGQSELGPAVDAVFLPQADARRITPPKGLDGLALVAGVGVLADLRLGDWQVDAQVGWALPSVWLDGGPHVSGFVWVGRRVW